MPPTRKRGIDVGLLQGRRAARNGGQPATEEGPWRPQSSLQLLMVPANASGQNMHLRIFWCADPALRWPVHVAMACTGIFPLRASCIWPGHAEIKGGVEQIRRKK